MESSTIALGSKYYNILKELAAKSGESIEATIEKAIEQYRRQKFLEEANQAYAALRSNPEAWASEIEEREAWNVTLADGLE